LRRKNQAVDAKKEACQKDSRIRGTKERSREKIPGSGGCCRKKDFRIKWTKEWSREKVPESGVQCGKRTTKKCNREKIPGSGSQDSATHEKEKRWWTGAL
jgi:hypothetical protein